MDKLLIQPGQQGPAVPVGLWSTNTPFPYTENSLPVRFGGLYEIYLEREAHLAVERFQTTLYLDFNIQNLHNMRGIVWGNIYKAHKKKSLGITLSS